MFHRLFQIAALLSAFCLVCTLIIWPVSHFRRITASYTTSAGTFCCIGGQAGRMMVTWEFKSRIPASPHFQADAIDPDSDWTKWSYLTWRNSYSTGDWPPPTNSLGVGWLYWDLIDVYALAIPFSYVATIFSILPFIGLASRFRRRRRSQRGLCPTCGYDLRASPARCPECGTTKASKTSI